MATEDFKYNTETGVFYDDVSTTVLSDVIMSVVTKSVSSSKNDDGKPVYPGDWFCFPNYGSSVYEEKAVRSDTAKRIKNKIELSLKHLLTSKACLSVVVDVVKSPINMNTFLCTIEVVEANGNPVTYDYFVEVI